MTYERGYINTNAMGWQCPKCGACYAPCVPECRHCAPKKPIVDIASGTLVVRSEQEQQP